MTKTEMQDHHDQYHTLMHQARSAASVGNFRSALEHAFNAWPHIDGMMQLQKRQGNPDFVSVEALDLVLYYAPLLFDFARLNALDQLLADFRRIEKNTSADMEAKAQAARQQMWQAHRLWDFLELHPGARPDELRQNLQGDQDSWRDIVESWEKMDLICRVKEGGSYRLNLVTRMGEVIPGKCPACGHLVESPKSMLLEETICPSFYEVRPVKRKNR